MMCDEYDKWIEGKELRLSEFTKLQARLEAAEAVCEEVAIKHWAYEYHACPYMECPICRKLDNWRKVKDG